MTSQLGQLLRSLGRVGDETVSVLTQVPGQGGTLHVHWTTVDGADSLVDSLVGCNVWYGCQPLSKPDTGRGRATDVTGLVTLYADLDWKRDGKPNGMDRQEAMDMVAKLSEVLGEQPVGIVVSGNGIQPYWRTALLDPEYGKIVLSWWRHTVLSVATEMKVSIDSQVFDMARILRVPGPPNLKNVDDPRPTQFVPRTGGTISRAHLAQLMMLHPVVTLCDSDSSRYDRRGGDLSPRDSVRFFTDEQAERYIEEHVMPDLRNTPEGAGFNAALNAAAFSIAAFIPEFLTEDQATGILTDECARRWGSANAQDWATIDSGMRGCMWEAHRTPAEMANNPFWEFYESTDDLEVRPERKVREFHYGQSDALTSSNDETEIIMLHGMEFERAIHRNDAVPSEACYLSDEFWTRRPILSGLRDLAWATQTCPEALLLSTFIRIAGTTGPNVKVHGGIGAPAPLNAMGLLMGSPGQGKSVSWKVALRHIEIVGGAERVQVFTPASGPGLMTPFGAWRKGKNGAPGEYVRTSYNAIAFFDESDSFAGTRQRQGDTLSASLRIASMGGALNNGTMDVERRVQIDEGEYSFAMIACGQPLRMGWLLNAEEVAGGLVQRFLWAPASGLVHPVEMGEPLDVHIRLPFVCGLNPDENLFGQQVARPKAEKVMWAPENICKEIGARYRYRRIHGGDPLKAHYDLTMLKVSAYLALMDGRDDITEEDCALADEFLRMSFNTCDWTWAKIVEFNRTESDQKSKSRGRSDAVASVKTEAELIVGAMAAIIRVLVKAGDKGVTIGSFDKWLSAGQKSVRGPALLQLEDEGRIEEREERYYLA